VQREIAALAKRLAVIGIGLVLIVTLLYVSFRGGWLNGVLAGITLAMGYCRRNFL